MAKFEAGDVVRVDYKSPRAIEQWMQGVTRVGPGEVGVVKYTVPSLVNDSMNVPSIVTVTFPLLGTFGMRSQDLEVVQRGAATTE